MKRKLLIVLSAIAALLAIIGMWHIRPGGLHIHVDVPWDSVTVEYSNHPERITFTPSMKDLRVPAITHGIYRVGVHFPDGRTLWSTFFHYDAGVRQRIDLFFTPSSQPGSIHIRESYNRSRILFDGEARPEDTSRDHPVTLDWI